VQLAVVEGEHLGQDELLDWTEGSGDEDGVESEGAEGDEVVDAGDGRQGVAPEVIG
jgi:hypothetical protein